MNGHPRIKSVAAFGEEDESNMYADEWFMKELNVAMVVGDFRSIEVTSNVCMVE